jgi:hypothetical protein
MDTEKIIKIIIDAKDQTLKVQDEAHAQIIKSKDYFISSQEELIESLRQTLKDRDEAPAEFKNQKMRHMLR